MNKNVYTEKKLFSKMVFIMNALDQGWKVKKIKNKDNKYIFYKKNDDTKDVKSESFLELFVNDNMSAENQKMKQMELLMVGMLRLMTL
jgi:hypothetical protein